MANQQQPPPCFFINKYSKKKKKKVKAKYEGEKDIWMSGRICGQRGQTLQRAGGELSVSCDPVFKTGQAISHFKML